MVSGCDRLFSVAAPSNALVDGDVDRWLVNCAVALGSHAPNARWIAFFGISRLSIWIAMSVLLAITSAR